MSKLVYTPLEDLEPIHAALHAGFRSGKSKSIAYRKYQLLQLAYLLKDNINLFEDALAADLGRPQFETQFMDVLPALAEVMSAYHGVDKWSKPEKPPFTLNYTVMRPIIHKEPKGVVLIIGPFNYPLNSTIGPMAGAISAGNAVLIKPSENSPASSALLAELLPKYLDSSLYRIVNGGAPETTKLLELPWGHRGGAVGKIVGTAAGKTLTPVTLELGGKSPVIIDPECDLQTAARRILWGKFSNAGQTCTAPDYVLVPRSFQDTFVRALESTYKEFYPDSPSAPGAGSRIVSSRHFTRINNLLQATKGTVVLGGDSNEADKYIAPTVVKDVSKDDSLMTEELFGPILPIIPVEDVDEAIAFVNARDHPLALYVFSTNRSFKAKVFANTQSGAIVANETLMHSAVEGLPFGGIGPSGSGYHTGKFGFDTFTHLRASLDSPSWIDMLIKFRYPPYTDKKLKYAAKLFPSLPKRPTGPPTAASSRSRGAKWWLLALAVALGGVLTIVRNGAHLQ